MPSLVDEASVSGTRLLTIGNLMLILNQGKGTDNYISVARKWLLDSLSQGSDTVVALGYSMAEAVQELNKRLAEIGILFQHELDGLSHEHDLVGVTYTCVWVAVHTCTDDEFLCLQDYLSRNRFDFQKNSLVVDALTELYRTQLPITRRGQADEEFFQIHRSGSRQPVLWTMDEFPPFFSGDLYLLGSNQGKLFIPKPLWSRHRRYDTFVRDTLVVVTPRSVIFTSKSFSKAVTHSGERWLQAYRVSEILDDWVVGRLEGIRLSSLPASLIAQVK